MNALMLALKKYFDPRQYDFTASYTILSIPSYRSFESESCQKHAKLDQQYELGWLSNTGKACILKLGS